jgi:iron only hydrogenase large subunit-like protein
MFTSCCPGWVAMVEKSNPELIPYLSSCKSPQMMLGAVIKNYFAAECNAKPEDICNVSVMPCVRKQGEADREWFNTTGLARDVDHVMTTVELGKIFQERGIKLNELEESAFDNPIGEGSGGAVLFGTTGGVMEAALRTVYEVVSAGCCVFVLHMCCWRGLVGLVHGCRSGGVLFGRTSAWLAAAEVCCLARLEA